MDTHIPRRAYRRAHDWNKLILEFKSSSQSKAEFCAERSLNSYLFSKALRRSEVSSSFASYTVAAAASIVVEVGGIRVNLSGVDPVGFIKALAR